MAVQVRSVKALCGLASSGWAGRSSLGQSSLGGLCLGKAVKVGRGWVGYVQTGRGKAVKFSFGALGCVTLRRLRFGMLWLGVARQAWRLWSVVFR